MIKFKYIILGTTALLTSSLQLSAAANLIFPDDTTIGRISGKGAIKLSATAGISTQPRVTTTAKNAFDGGVEVDGVNLVAADQTAFGSKPAIKFSGRGSTIASQMDAAADLNILDKSNATLAPVTVFNITSITGSGSLIIASGKVVAPNKPAPAEATGTTTVGSSATFDLVTNGASEKSVPTGTFTLMPGSTLLLPSGKSGFARDIVLG